MAVPFDQRPDLIWFDGQLVPTSDAKVSVLTHALHYASAVFEGERAYGGEIFKCTEHSERLKRSGSILDFEIPYSAAEIDAAKRLIVEKNGMPNCYVRALAWRGSEALGVTAMANKIHLAIANWEWPSYFDPAQRLKGIRLDLADYRRPDPKTAPALRQGCRPLRDLHDLQARRRTQRLRRRDDAGLAGPRRRMHRRQHLLHQGRQDPHADRRLLPVGHHARHRDRAGEEARHRGDRAPHHAGGACRTSPSASSPARRRR